MAWINNINQFIDFLSLVIVHAPDDFPEEDYLAADEQLSLESAYQAIRDGMQYVVPRIPDPAVTDQLSAQLEQSLGWFRQGDAIAGAHLLQDVERTIKQAIRYNERR